MSLAKWFDFQVLGDTRGSLVALELGINVPFDIKRIYYIYGTKKDVSRGFHAHLDLKQLAVCLSGSCIMVLDNGETREEVHMDSPEKGLLIEGLLWREMHNFSEDCILLVMASEHFDEKDYIRNYQDFMRLVENA